MKIQSLLSRGLTSFALLTGITSFPASALEITLSTNSTSPGNNVAISVTLSGAPTNLSALAFYVTNTSAWPLPAAASAPAQSHVNCFVDDFSNGVHRVTAFVLDEPPVQNGALLTLTYAVPPNALPGTYPLLIPVLPVNAPPGSNPEARTLASNQLIPAFAHAGSILVLAERPYLTSLAKLANGNFRFRFDSTIGSNYSVLATTNVALPLTNWDVLGTPSLFSPGVFEFADPAAANYRNRYYILKAN